MSYEKHLQQLQIVNRGLNRIEAIKVDAEYKAAKEIQKTSALAQAMNDKETFKALQSAKGFLAKMRIVCEFGQLSQADVDWYEKILISLKFWQSRKRVISERLVVSYGNNFDIRLISQGKKGIQISLSHPSLKTAVTRHLRLIGDTWTGRPPFGEASIDAKFIPYDVTIGTLSLAQAA